MQAQKKPNGVSPYGIKAKKWWQDYINSRMFFIIIVACGTTGYTIFDSQVLGVAADLYRCGQTADFAFLLLHAWYLPDHDPASDKLSAAWLKDQSQKHLCSQSSGWRLPQGAFASLTYVTALLAMNYVTNVSYVQVFCQLGLIFGLLGCIIILKERCSASKITGTLLIIAGLVITVL